MSAESLSLPIHLPEPAPLRLLDVAAPAIAAEPGPRHPVSVYLARLTSQNSRRAVLRDLHVIAGLLTGGLDQKQRPYGDPWTLPWAAVAYGEANAVRAELAARYAPASANRMLCSLRGVITESWNLGQMDSERYHRAVKVKSVKGSRLPKGRALTAGEIRALFAACAADPGTGGIRDAAMIAVLYAGGLRREEAVVLDLPAYASETGAVRVLGKGNKERFCYIGNAGGIAVDVWLQVRGGEPGKLFLPVHRSGKIQHAQRVRRGARTGEIAPSELHEQSVYDMLQKRALQAGVPPFSPHDLRRTFASDLLDAGADLSLVQQLMGHVDPRTTQQYDRRGEAAKRKAASLLHVPYVPRG